MMRAVANWPLLACIASLILVAPAHLLLWLPKRTAQGKKDNRAPASPDPKPPMTALLLGVLAIHLAWTLLASLALVPGLSSLAWLLLGNLLLTPCTFAWVYELWVCSSVRDFPSDQPWEAGTWPDSMEQLPTVAVVVPCRNEPLEVVQLTLRSILDLNYPRAKLMLVVSDNSDEQNVEWRELRQYIQELQIQGENVCLLHRNSTQGFKAGNLDLALENIEAELVLFVDVDNTLPAELLIGHVSAFRSDPSLAFLQFYNLPVNQPMGALAAASASLLQYWKALEFIRGRSSGWTFFQGHNCIWRTSTLKQIAPLNRTLFGQSLLVEDLHMTIRANQLGQHGLTVWSPAAFWAPVTLMDLERMLVRWSYGNNQILVKEWLNVKSSESSVLASSSYPELIYQLTAYPTHAVLPALLLILPGSVAATSLLVSGWILSNLVLPAAISLRYASARDAVNPRTNAGHPKMLEVWMLRQFASWCVMRALVRFASGRPLYWVPTGKTSKPNSSFLKSQPANASGPKQMPSKRHPFLTPLLLYGSLLLGLLLRQWISPPSINTALAWFPLALQAATVLAVICLYGGSRTSQSPLIVESCPAVSWKSISEHDATTSLVAKMTSDACLHDVHPNGTNG